MDSIHNFIKHHQCDLSPTKNIIISIGNFLENDKILNCRIEESIIKNLLKKIKQKKLRYTTENVRIYKEANMDYYIKEKSECNITNNYIDILNVTLDNIGLRLKLIEFTHNPIETFPCKLEYGNELNRSIIKVNYNNLLELYIITEEKDQNRILKLEIHITKQNIYEDKVLANLTELIKLIQDVFKN